MAPGLRLCLACCGLVLVAGRLRAEEQYAVKLTPPGQGGSTTTDFDVRIRLSLKKWDGAGKVARPGATSTICVHV